jgi:two-component system response regulator QseB
MHGYAIDWVRDGAEALQLVESQAYDTIVLDRRLPGVHGVEILRSLRAHGIDVPVLMLTACDSLEEKVVGLDAGADDYLTKPFELDELFARIRSLLRRTGNRAATLKAGGVELNPATREVSFKGKSVGDFTLKEYAILEMLVRNKGRFVTKSRLLEGINNWDEDVESNTVEVYVSRLRKRFDHDLIETLRGVGYRIK